MRTEPLQNFVNDRARRAGLNLENKDKGLCVKCSRPAVEHCKTQAGRDEFAISGLCEECFDGIFDGEDHE